MSSSPLVAGRWLVPPGVDPPRPGAGRLLVLHVFAAGLAEAAAVEAQLLDLVADDGEVALAGVHVPRTPAEAAPERVAGWRDELGATHAILLDDDASAARALGVEGLPSIVVLDPAGRIAAILAGEGQLDALAGVLRLAREEAAAAGRLAAPPPAAGAAPRAPAPERSDTATALRRPSGIAIDRARGLIAVADTAHHRVVLATLDGRVLRTVGSGQPAHRDGRGGAAALRSPRGVAFHHGHLYVADEGNHALRRIDPATGDARTIAAGGRLRGPRGLAAFGPYVAVTSALGRQIWAYDPDSGRLGPIAGHGGAGHSDGPAHEALLDQPEGLAFVDDEDGERLWIADPEAGALRVFEVLDARGPRLATPPRPAGDVTLVRPTGLAAVAGGLAIADPALGAVVRRDAATGALTRLTAATAGLVEPTALATLDEHRLLIADAGDHLLRRLDLRSGELAPFLLLRLTPPRVVPRRLPRLVVAPGTAAVTVRLDAPAVAVSAGLDEQVVVRGGGVLELVIGAADVTLRVQARSGGGAAAREVSAAVPLAVAEGGPTTAVVDLRSARQAPGDT